MYPNDCTQPNDYTPVPGATLTPGELCPTGIVVESFTAHSAGVDTLSIVLLAFLLAAVCVFAIAKRRKML